MLDVKRLRVLREVAARGSFSAAADALSYTQSAVSQQIAALEREAGTPLVERGGRGVRITEAGRLLVGHADAVLCRLAQAQADLDAIRGLGAGRVRLGAFPSAGATLVPAALAKFRERHPGIDVEIALVEPPDGLQGIRAGDQDIVLTLESRDGAEDDLAVTPVLDDPMFIALPAGHPFADRTRISLGDLSHEPWMLGATNRCPDRLVFLEACRSQGFEPQVALSTDDYNAIQGFVAAGMGVALIPQLALVNVRDDIVVRAPTGPAPVRKVLAATTHGAARVPAVEAMLGVLVEAGAEMTPQFGPALAVA